jgi:hypothetical protein
MTKTLRGVVHGKTIELTEELPMPEGQTVDVTVTPALTKPTHAARQALREAMTETDWEAWEWAMEQNRRARKVPRPRPADTP